MSAKSIKLLAVVSLSLFIGILLTAGPVLSKTHKMRIQCVYPETSNGGMMLKTFADKVKKYSNGQIQTDLYWPNQLVKVGEAFNAASKGLVEGVYAATIYFTGTVPELKVEWLAHTWKTPEMAYDIYYENGLNEFLQKAYLKHDVYLLGTWFTGTMGFMTNFDVKGLDDFKGKKVRAMSADAPLANLMGITPVALAGAEIYMALQRKTIDGAIYPYYVLETYKLYEVVSTVILPGIHSPNPTSLLLSNDFYKSLTPELQFALERAGQELALLSVIWSNKWDEEALAFGREKKMNIITLSEEDQKKLDNLAQQIWAEVEKNSPECKEGIDLVRTYLKDKGDK